MTNEERLAEIRESLADGTYDNYPRSLIKDEISWLIERVETVERLLWTSSELLKKYIDQYD